jgi:5-methylcytosine-specific restriction endonuclease McrA
MTERAPISKKLRFEVFKRDKFTCQYCGAIGGQVLLHCDHVVPVAEGGETTLLNLTTACVDCNLGKGARRLSDDSALAKQHRQLADLEERRQQLEMMRQWREELARQQVDQVSLVADAFLARSKFEPSEHGKLSVRRWLRKYGLHEVLAAIDETFDLYYTGHSQGEWEDAFRRIPRTLGMRQQEKTDPHIRKLLYIQGILRNRFDDERGNYVERVRDALQKGYPIDVLETYAKGADSWSNYVELLTAWSKRQATVAPQEEDDRDPANCRADTEMEESLSAWLEPRWHIQMFGDAFSDRQGAGGIKGIAEWCTEGGRVDQTGGKIAWQDVPILRGYHAVGLIRALERQGEVTTQDERGNLYPSFRLVSLSPREATNAFSRFGSLRLGFWDNPMFFARVDQVH